MLSFAVLEYLQKRRFVIMVTGNTYKDVLPNAWYADEDYKWTAEDIYECKYNGKRISEAFALHVVANLLKSSGALYRIHGIISCVQLALTEECLTAEIKKLKKDSTTFSAYLVSEFAEAALDLLHIESYEGNSEEIKRLIASKLRFE